MYPDLSGSVVEKGSLASLHSIVGLIAGLTSIAGGVYSAVRYVTPGTGELVAFVRTADGDGAVAGATVEVLTPGDTLVTTLTPSEDGRARRTLDPGSYVLRVRAPRFQPQARPIELHGGGTTQVSFRLAAAAQKRRTAAVSAPARAVDKGVGAAQRLFRGLGL